jgi:hypothetical protein
VTRKYGRTHDGKGFVIYKSSKPPGPYIKSYDKEVMDYQDVLEQHAAMTEYLKEQAPPATDWLLGDTDG